MGEAPITASAFSRTPPRRDGRARVRLAPVASRYSPQLTVSTDTFYRSRLATSLHAFALSSVPLLEELTAMAPSKQ